MRTPLERQNNAPGHDYRIDPLSQHYVCRRCGTCERRRTGIFWWAGKWSQEEPPCVETDALREWHDRANEDTEPDAIRWEAPHAVN